MASREELRKTRVENLKRISFQFESMSQLARVLGKSVTQINDMLKGNKSFGDKIAREIENSLGMVSGSLDRSLEEELGENKVDIFIQSSRRIPLITFVQAGSLTDNMDRIFDEYLDVDLGCSRESFGLRIRGESMLPEFREGDIVIIDPEICPRAGDFVVVRSLKGLLPEAAFKQYAVTGIDSHGREIFEARSLNPLFPNFKSEEHMLEVVGTMYEHRRRRRP